MKRLQAHIKQTIHNPNHKDILSKSFGFIIFRGLGIIFGYAFTYLVASRYGASMNGLITLGFAVFMFASTVSTFGVDVHLVKYYSNPLKWKNEPGLFYKVYLKTFSLSLLITLILYLFRDLIVVQLFNKPQFIDVYLWAIIAIPGWTMIKLSAGVLRAKGLNNWFSFFNNTGKFCFAFFLLLVFDFILISPLNAIKAHFYAITFLSIIGFIVVYKNFKKITITGEENSWKFMTDSFPMLISTSIIVFLNWIDSFVLGIYVSDSEIGVYNVAIKIALGASFAMEAINSGLAPRVARLFYEKKRVELDKLVRFSTILNFIITVIITLILIIFNQFFLGLFGEEFKSGYWVLMILCLMHLLNSFFGSAAIIMQMIGYHKQYQYNAILTLILNLVLNFILIPTYGNIGAAVGTSVSLTIWFVLNAIFLKRKENLVTYFNPFSKNIR